MTEIPKEMQDLTHRSDDISRRADSLVTLFEDAAREGTDLFNQITHALDELHESGKTTADDMHAGMETVEHSTDALKSTSETGMHTLETVKTEVLHAFEAFENTLKAGADDWENHAHELQQGVDKLHAAVQTGQGELDSDHQHLASEVETAHNQVETTKNHMTEKANALHSEATTKNHDVQSELHTMLEGFNHVKEALTGHLGETIENVVHQGATQLVDTVKQKIEDEMKHLLDDAKAQLLHAIDGMSGKADETKSDSGSARDLLEPLFHELEQFIDPLKAVIDGVKSAASVVGISFG